MRIRWRTHLLALLAYTLLALVLTWPLLTAITTHVPGNGADDPPLTWNLWWVRYSLLELRANPFDCGYLFHPIGINLAFYTLTLLNAFLSIPLQASAGLVTASNMLLLSSFVLSGYGTFLLSAYLLGTHGHRSADDVGSWPRQIIPMAAFSAGLLYAFASSKLFYAALGQWNIASSQWIPFYVLYLFKVGDRPTKLRYSLLAGVFMILQAYAELTYASFLALFTILWAAWRAWLLRSRAYRAQIGRLAVSTLFIALLTVLGLTPVLAKMVPDMLAEGDILAEGGGFADAFSADLLGFLVPTSLHPLLGNVTGTLSFAHDVGQHLYLGYSALALCAAAVLYWGRRFRRGDGQSVPATGCAPADSASYRHSLGKIASLTAVVRFWCLSAVVWWLLTLGPTLRVNGTDTGVPLPFRLLEQVPFFRGNRYPSRFSVLLTLSLAVLVGLGVAALMESSRRQGNRRRQGALRWAALLLVLVAAFEHLSVPLALSDMRVPPVYQSIASTMPGDWTLLDIPVAWRNGSRVTGTLDTTIMFEQWYQSAHQKRLLAGNTSRNPRFKFQYFADAPVISTLVALETGHDVPAEQVARDRLLAADVLYFFGIEAILVHPDAAGTQIVPYVESVMPVTRFYDAEGIAGYRVAPRAAPDGWTLTPGDELSRLSYAEGWGTPSGRWIWAQRNEARLFVPLNGSPQSMAFQALAPQPGQVLTLEVNGYSAGRVELQEGPQSYSIDLPDEAIIAGLNEIILRFGQISPMSMGQGDPGRTGRKGFDSPLNLVVVSAGNEVGDLGLVYVNGNQVSPNGRGYNVVVVDEWSGTVLDAATFDTHMDPSASQALAQYLQQIPEGRVVAIAAADDASRLLGPEAVEAMQTIGATGDLRSKFRWGHAIIGERGAAPGTALEAMGWIRPVSLSLGTGATEPHLAAAFGPIKFSARDR